MAWQHFGIEASVGYIDGNIKMNKHCEILVSCSDKERNCMQACETACTLMKLDASSWNFM